jgi:predicted MPP superfamily phosphohydrolase
MLRRLIIFCCILLTVYFFLGFMWLGLLPFGGLAKLGLWLVLLAPFASIIWLFSVLFERDEEKFKPSDEYLQWFIFFGMGLMSFLFVFTAIRTILSLVFTIVHATSADNFMTSEPMFWIIGGAAVFSVLIGGLIARLRLEVTQNDIVIEKLPEAFDGFKIAQISDLHIGATIGPKFVKRVVKTINALQVDAVVLTGDIVDGYFSRQKDVIALLGEIKAAHARVYMTGNHEYYWGAEPFIAEFKRLGFSVPINSSVAIEKQGAKISIAGVPDYMSENPKPDPKKALAGIPEGQVKILLAHQPSFANAAAEAGFDLMLSGHTHGGQFFPWTLAVGFFYQFSRGLGRLGKMWVYVNRGTGYWGPPIRLGSPAEISVLTLRSRRK